MNKSKSENLQDPFQKKEMNLFVLGDDVLEEFCIDFGVVPLLLQVHTINLLGFDFRGLIGGIDLIDPSDQGLPTFNEDRT